MTPETAPELTQAQREARHKLIATAIDKLNSWVRSNSGRSSPRWAIYDWKRHFIEESLRAGLVQDMRAIRLSLTCRDCGGSKRYTDSYGQTFPWCRKCGSKGSIILRFLVTNISGYTWHTPERETWRISNVLVPSSIWEQSTLSVDWEPNQKGRDIEVAEAAKWLNILEAEYPNVPGSHGVYDYGDWIGDQDHKKYRLYLGRTEPKCAFCGALEESGELRWYHVVRDHVEWSACACVPCEVAHRGGEPSIFKLFPVPGDKLQDPEIRTWLGRRSNAVTERVA